MSSKTKKSSARVLRTCPAALNRPTERRKGTFGASVGEKGDDLEVQMLNRGFLVKRKVVVAERDAHVAAYLEAATKEGLPFFVALSPDSYVLARDGEQVGVRDSRGQRRLADPLAVEEALGCLDFLCGVGFACEGGYEFAERSDNEGASRRVTIVFERSAPGAEGPHAPAPGADPEACLAAEGAAPVPLVSQSEVLENAEEVKTIVAEAWRRLYDRATEKSCATIKNLQDAIRSLSEAYDALSEAAQGAGAALADGVEKLAPRAAQYREAARSDPRYNSDVASLEAALAERHQGLRRLHRRLALLGPAAAEIGEMKNQLRRAAGDLAPMKDLAVS